MSSAPTDAVEPPLKKYVVVVYPGVRPHIPGTMTLTTTCRHPRVSDVEAATPEAAAEVAKVQPGERCVVIPRSKAKMFQRPAAAPLEGC